MTADFKCTKCNSVVEVFCYRGGDQGPHCEKCGSETVRKYSVERYGPDVNHTTLALRINWMGR